ncbi:MAG: glycosyl hydrolase family 18 protein [Rhodanobacter sp.]
MKACLWGAPTRRGWRAWTSCCARGALAVLMLVLVGCVAHVTDKMPLQTWGYASWWSPPTAVQLDRAQLDRLMFFQIEMGVDGRIKDAHGWPSKYEPLRDAAKQRGLPLDVTVTLQGKDDFEKLFGNPASVQRLLETCIALANDSAVAGLQLDFETFDEVTPASIAGLRGFVPRLAAVLHAASLKRLLSVFIPSNGQILYDRASLAKVDWDVMQSYDAHWATSEQAGPIAPLNGGSEFSWVKAVAMGDALGVAHDRMIMTYPLYGYEWPTQSQDARARTTGPAATTTLEPVSAAILPLIQTNVRERVSQFGCQHEHRSGSSFYRFRDPVKGWVVGWYEGAWSLRLKRQFVIDHDLAGIAFFVLGYDDDRLVGSVDKSRSTAYGDAVVQGCL